MLHGKIRAGEETWAPEARLHRWKNDQLEDLHNDDALWGFMIRASEEYRLMDHTKLRDPVMRSLLRMGIFDWKGDALERSFEAEKKEKAQVFTRFDEDISELDRRASRHRCDIEKVDSKVNKMAEWEEKCQTLTNNLLARVQILEERDDDKNGQILELTEKVLELEG